MICDRAFDWYRHPWSRSRRDSHLKETPTKEAPTPGLKCVSSELLCNFIAIYLTFVQFILQLKLCLYAIVHLLSEYFRKFSHVILYTQSLCHTISPIGHEPVGLVGTI